ncbi:MAG: hypothetical protein R2733_07505 [Acidimicrobiales bacterium]
MNALHTTRRVVGAAATTKGPEAGQTLLGHAVQLIEERQWKPALDVLDSARRLRPDDPSIDELTVIAAAHARRRKQLKAALARLEEREELGASAYHAQAVAALVDHRYTRADALARKSIEADPSSPAGWADLAASFAGLGWFDEATDCLTVAAEKGGVAATQQWRLGRAVNHWALAGSGALIITAAATVLVGLLALAVGLSSTILVREIRVHHLPEPFRGAAEWQWRSEHVIKLTFGLGVLLSVVGFVAAQIYLSGNG